MTERPKAENEVYNEDVIPVVTPKVRHLKYESLRRRLQDEKDWPILYQHKIIGKNVSAFTTSLEAMRKDFPRLNLLDSTTSKNGTYKSYTFEILARDVDEIIVLWVASEQLEELITVL